MRRARLAILAAAAALVASEAKADLFDFNFSGNGVIAAGSFTVASTLPGPITNVSGTAGGVGIDPSTAIGSLNAYVDPNDFNLTLKYSVVGSTAITTWHFYTTGSNTVAFCDLCTVYSASGTLVEAPAPIPGAGSLSLAFFVAAGLLSRTRPSWKLAATRVARARLGSR